ncbi:MAG TPA: HD domain-containing phosphohydrolase [Mariprofundaceae bacterium]|nr:HD domain-containing phosphohydrolase [Mariprofundaceae bacterium]
MDPQAGAFEAMFGYHRSLSAALGYRDMLTLVHSERVRDLSLMIVADCDAGEHDLAVLKMASTFHDVGKIGIPDQILQKPGRLDAEEWATIKRHSEIGEQIMLSSGMSGQAVVDVARAIRHHHEYFDGGGYPDGLAGEDIPLAARIIAIADSYDAMAVTRAYHAPRAHGEIMAIMHGETGSKFDPELMDLFSRHIESSPLRAD